MHHDLGLDLVDFFRGRHSWGKLARLLAQLRAGTHYWAALVDDDEAAEAAIAANPKLAEEKESRQMPPDLEDLSLDNQLLMGISDLLGSLLDGVAALAGDTSHTTQPMPRPSTALQRARDKRVQSKLDGLLEEALEAIKRSEESSGKR